MSNQLQGKKVAVFGVANKRSIAWAIAQAMQAAGQPVLTSGLALSTSFRRRANSPAPPEGR